MVLFHVTANAEWSSLPLSGLFVSMLERLTQSAGGVAAGEEALEGAVWTPVQVLDGFGEAQAPSLVAGVPGEELAVARASAVTPPGIYASGDRRAALNVMRAEDRLEPMGALPDGVVVEALERAEETRLGPWLIALALVLLALDVLATLVVSGRLRNGGRPARGATAAAGLALAVFWPERAARRRRPTTPPRSTPPTRRFWPMSRPAARAWTRSATRGFSG